MDDVAGLVAVAHIIAETVASVGETGVVDFEGIETACCY